MPIDKRQPYEFDIRVPFLLRGPGIPANTSSEVPVLMVDVAPTLLDIAGTHTTRTQSFNEDIDKDDILVTFFRLLSNE